MIDTPLKLIVHRTWEQIQHWKKKDRKLQTVTKKIGYSDGTNDNNDQKEHFHCWNTVYKAFLLSPILCTLAIVLEWLHIS